LPAAARYNLLPVDANRPLGRPADNKLVLVRLSDGATTTIGTATYARLDAAGLFYAWHGPQPWPGRIRFIPLDQLPLG
jgi:hypothetical protein